MLKKGKNLGGIRGHIRFRFFYFLEGRIWICFFLRLDPVLSPGSDPDPGHLKTDLKPAQTFSKKYKSQ